LRLGQATEPRHLDLPGWRLHPLRGDLAGYWSITVSANRRIIFLEQGDATDVDLVDYH
jgi:toxin HigB-1